MSESLWHGEGWELGYLPDTEIDAHYLFRAVTEQLEYRRRFSRPIPGGGVRRDRYRAVRVYADPNGFAGSWDLKLTRDRGLSMLDAMFVGASPAVYERHSLIVEDHTNPDLSLTSETYLRPTMRVSSLEDCEYVTPADPFAFVEARESAEQVLRDQARYLAWLDLAAVAVDVEQTILGDG